MTYVEGHTIVGEIVTDQPRHKMKNEVKYRETSVKQDSTKDQEENIYLFIPTYMYLSQHSPHRGNI